MQNQNLLDRPGESPTHDDVKIARSQREEEAAVSLRRGYTNEVLLVAITVLTLATASVHFYLAAQPDEDLRVLFFFNASGYLSLLGALYLPMLAKFRSFVCAALAGYTVVTIVSWLLFGQPYDIVGVATKSDELVLVAVLLLTFFLPSREQKVALAYSKRGTNNRRSS